MESLGEFSLTFNGEIDLAPGAKASLYEDDAFVMEVPLSVDEADPAVAKADFGGQSLYKTHSYKVVVEENSAFPKGETEGGNSAYTANYTGDSYRPLEATVRPGQNRKLASLSEIDINPKFPDGYGFVSTGEEQTFNAFLYKGGKDGELVSELTLGLTSNIHLGVTDGKVQLQSNSTYTLVVPEDEIIPYEIGVSGLKPNPEYRQFEWVFTWQTAPAPVNVNGSSVVAGAPVASLGLAAFHVSGATTVADGASMRLMKDGAAVSEAPLSLTEVSGNPVAIADFSDAAHTPLALDADASYLLVLPEGSLKGEDGEVANEEKTVSFSGPASVKVPVFHNVTLTLDNAAAQTSAVEEGRTVSFMLTPADDLWTLESVSNATPDAESGMYVTAPVTADLDVKAVFALVNPVDFDFTTGVEAVGAECRYRVYSEGTHLVVEGVAEGDCIRVYTAGGTLMADRTVPANADTVSMTLAGGIYIVAINGTTVKVRH